MAPHDQRGAVAPQHRRAIHIAEMVVILMMQIDAPSLKWLAVLRTEPGG